MPLEPASSSVGTASQAPEVDNRHPWLGLLPYKEEHREFFFGRDREVEDILGRIRDNGLTILYGQSGLGKSSLLAAGVVPRLREAGYAPTIIRLTYDARQSSLLEQTHAAFASTDGHATLWQHFHHRDTSASPIPVLIFDQFEEIFTLGAKPEFEAEVTEWLEQMADLLQNRPPRILAERFAQDSSLAEQYRLWRCPCAHRLHPAGGLPCPA